MPNDDVDEILRAVADVASVEAVTASASDAAPIGDDIATITALRIRLRAG